MRLNSRTNNWSKRLECSNAYFASYWNDNVYHHPSKCHVTISHYTMHKVQQSAQGAHHTLESHYIIEQIIHTDIVSILHQNRTNHNPWQRIAFGCLFVCLLLYFDSERARKQIQFVGDMNVCQNYQKISDVTFTESFLTSANRWQ